MTNPNPERDERVRQTHGFAPMDSLSDVCGAYTSDGYCWRPRKHPVHEAGTSMGLHECNTPAQGFNAEREKKVAERAATRMRDRCVAKVREYLTDCRDEEREIIEAIASELRSLTLEEKNYAADGFSSADR